MSLDAARERDWIRRAQAGDRDAFEALVLFYRPHALRFAQSLVHSPADAEDIVQEAFARVYLRLSTLRPDAPLKPWLFSTIRNRCIDHLRARPQEDAWPDGFTPPGGHPPDAALLRREEWDAFLARYSSLPPAARTALYLFAVEGMSYSDIAQVLHTTPVQLKMLIYRTRKKLKQPDTDKGRRKRHE